MDIADEFGSQLRSSITRPSYRSTLLPEMITQMVVQLLPVDGASLSLLSEELRMPLAASDEQARAAEMMQFTVGDGPCLDTYRTGRTQSAGEAELAARWPMYLAGLAERTSYRSVASVALDLGSRLVGALDLYLDGPDRLPAAALAEAHRMAAVATDFLAASPHADEDDPAGPEWLRNPAMQDRATTRIAIGLLSRAADLAADDALDLLRAYAWQEGRTVDDVSLALASRALTAEQLLDRP